MPSASAVPRSGYLPVVYLSGLNAKNLAGVICGLAIIPAITIPIAVRGERGGRALNVNRRGRDRDRCLNSSGGLRHANRDFPAAHVDGLLRRSAAFLSTFGYGLFILTLAALFAVGIVIDPARAAQKVPKLDIPQSFAPEQAAKASTYELSSSAALKAPPGAEKVFLTPSDLRIDGAFDELAEANAAARKAVVGRNQSVAALFEAAAALEKAYADAGYFLVRVTIPAQKLVPGGPVRFVVIDGFFEELDASRLPKRVQKPVLRLTERLLNQRHMQLKTVERALLLASDINGMTLRSVMNRGKKPGGVVLLFDGSHRLIQNSMTVDNSLSAQLGTWRSGSRTEVNSALGLGESFYASVAQGKGDRLSSVFDPDKMPMLLLAAGVVVPLGSDGFSINPEVTYSKSLPKPSSGGMQSEGIYKRFAFRGSYDLKRSKQTTISVKGTVDYQDQTWTSLSAGTGISTDRYTALRAELDGHTALANGLTSTSPT